MSTRRVCCSFAKAYRAEAARVQLPVEGGDMESDSYDSDSESYESGKTDTLIFTTDMAIHHQHIGRYCQKSGIICK